MSLKEKLKGSWTEMKKDWQQEKATRDVLKKKEAYAYRAEKLKQANIVGKERAKIETARRLKKIRTPARDIGFAVSPIFSGGMFGEPMGLRRPKKVSHKKRTGALYVDGHRIESRPNNRKKSVHRRKKTRSYGFFDDSLF